VAVAAGAACAGAAAGAAAGAGAASGTRVRDGKPGKDESGSAAGAGAAAGAAGVVAEVVAGSSKLRLGVSTGAGAGWLAELREPVADEGPSAWAMPVAAAQNAAARTTRAKGSIRARREC